MIYSPHSFQCSPVCLICDDSIPFTLSLQSIITSPFSRAATKSVSSQAVVMHVVILSEVQDFALLLNFIRFLLPQPLSLSTFFCPACHLMFPSQFSLMCKFAKGPFYLVILIIDENNWIRKTAVLTGCHLEAEPLITILWVQTPAHFSVHLLTHSSNLFISAYN